MHVQVIYWLPCWWSEMSLVTSLGRRSLVQPRGSDQHDPRSSLRSRSLDPFKQCRTRDLVEWPLKALTPSATLRREQET